MKKSVSNRVIEVAAAHLAPLAPLARQLLSKPRTLRVLNTPIDKQLWQRGLGLLLLPVLFSGCDKQPPDYRAMVTLPEYTQGDADNGQLIYKDACSQCHQLTPGLNKKGPQLLNIYGAKVGLLNDYKYSEALKATGWVWDAETLDKYIADPEKAVPDSKMLADPMPDAQERKDVIAYLSTLRAPVPVSTDEKSSQ